MSATIFELEKLSVLIRQANHVHRVERNRRRQQREIRGERIRSGEASVDGDRVVANSADDYAEDAFRNVLEEESAERICARSEIERGDRDLSPGERRRGIAVSDNTAKKHRLSASSGGEAHYERDLDPDSKRASHSTSAA